jgi:PAS domain S-box-containing protein
MSENPTSKETQAGVWKLAQRAPRPSETEEDNGSTFELLPFVIKHSPIYVYLKEVFHNESKVVFASDNFVDITGISASQMTGKTMSELFPHEFAKRITRDDMEITCKGNRLEIEEEFAGRNYLTYKFPIRQGDKNYLAGYSIDITERKEMERKLTLREREYRTLVESLPDFVVRYDLNLRRTYVNPAWEKASGLSAAEVLNVPHTDIPRVPAPAADEYVQKLRQVMETGVSQAIEFAWVNADGVKLYLDYLIVPEYDHSGKISGLLAVGRDITQKKQGEEVLRKSEQKWRNILVDLPQIGISLDPQARIAFANRYFLHLTGWDKEEIIGKNWLDLFIPEDKREEIWKVFKTIMAQKDSLELYTHENEILTRTGDLRSIAWSNVLNKDVQGNIADITCIGIDLTERRVAEKKLIKQKKLFETMFHTISDGVIITDTRREIQLANKSVEHTFGYEPEELLGQNTEMLYADQEKYREAGETVFGENAKKPEDIFVTQYRHKSGRKFPVEILGAKLFDDNNRWIGNLGIVRDITDRKQAEAALRESEKKYRSMMEAFADPLYICSPDFTVEYMNPAMIRRIGRDATGERCHFALHGLDAMCDWCAFDKVLSGDKVETNVKSPLDQRDYRVTHMPIRNQNGTISKMTIFRDITDYLQAVSEKEKAQAQLMQAQKMESIGILAGGIAHDFNNILSSIIGFTELALDEVPTGTTTEDSLQEVHSAGKRAKELVKQILAFARQSDEKRSPIQPRMIVEEVLKFIRSTIPSTIKIRQDIKSDSLIMGNATQVHQVLMNLCTNAAHAMEDSGGVLIVKLKDVVVKKENSLNTLGLSPGDYVEIAVADTGVGIAPEIIGSIFDPYFTTKDSGEGTGMGLAMVHGIVESYGGRITVDSRLGKGTTFSIYLPVTGKRSAVGAYVPEQLPSGKERILFVDDELTLAKMGSKILTRLGYAVTTRTSSIEALELFRAKPGAFDLVITDMTMPNLTGDKLAVELMKIRGDIPIILCTGYSKKISDETALEIGIKAFTYKPMVRADLAKTVRKVLDDAE